PEEATESLTKGFSGFLKLEDTIFSPLIRPLIDGVKKLLQPDPALTADLGQYPNDADRPIVAATGVAFSAAMASWLLSYARIDEGEPLKWVAEVIAGAVGWEEMRDVQIGPLVHNGIGLVAQMQARKMFRQTLPGSTQLARWESQGLLATDRAKNLMAYHG